MMIPENAPVRLLNAQLEELEYGKLYEAYSPKGKTSAADPRVLFKVLVHGYLCGIYSSRKLEEAYRYRIDFRWLLEDRKPPDHSTLAVSRRTLQGSGGGAVLPVCPLYRAGSCI